MVAYGAIPLDATEPAEKIADRMMQESKNAQ